LLQHYLKLLMLFNLADPIVLLKSLAHTPLQHLAFKK